MSRKEKSVNVESALELLGGYKIIFDKIARQFLENQKKLVTDVKKSLKCDLEEARRLVHSCKGISKNLGANQLYQISSSFELAIIDEDREQIECYMKMFKVEFKQVLKELKQILK